MQSIVNHFPPDITNSTQSTCHLASFPGSAGRAWERGYMSSTACYKMVPLCQGVGSWEQSPYAHFKILQQTLARTSDAHSCDSHTRWTMLHSNISSIMSKLNTLLSSIHWIIVSFLSIFKECLNWKEYYGLAILKCCNHDKKVMSLVDWFKNHKHARV